MHSNSGIPAFGITANQSFALLKYVWRDDGGPHFHDAFNVEPSRSFISDEPKMLVALNYLMYHVLLEDFSSILYFYKENPATHFLIYTPHNGDTHIAEYIFAQLDKLNIKYTVIDKEEVIAVDNFSHLDHFIPNQDTVVMLAEVVRASITNKDETPHRKIYISRGRVHSAQEKMISFEDKNTLTGFDDKRIDDEQQLEQYFSSKGFEILYPEDLNSFQEQVDLISSAKVMVSVFSSGLMSMLMMKKGQTIVDIPVLFAVPNKKRKSIVRVLYMQYPIIAYYLGLHYCSVADTEDSDSVLTEVLARPDVVEVIKTKYYPIPTKRKVDQVVAAFEGTSHLKALLS